MKNDLSGAVFGYLTVLSPAGRRRRGRASESVWLCRCKCGRTIEVGRTRLIGKLKRYCSVEHHREDFVTAVRAASPHPGASRDLAYSSWRKMLRRCAPGGKYAPNGTKVCERWAASYGAFLADMGEMPSSAHSIERTDTLGHYEPGNCVWALPVQQTRNKRTTRWVQWRGERRKLVEVCEAEGVRLGLVAQRLKLGWAIEAAIAMPSRGWRKMSPRETVNP